MRFERVSGGFFVFASQPRGQMLNPFLDNALHNMRRNGGFGINVRPIPQIASESEWKRRERAFAD